MGTRDAQLVKTMRILYLSYERGIELEDFRLPNGTRVKHQVMYTDIDEIRKEGLTTVVSWVREFKPQLIIEREFNDGKAVYTDLLTQFPQVKKAVWLIDTHCSLARHREYARNFDYVFLAISSYLDEMKVSLGHERVYWLPLCYPNRSDSIHLNYNEVKYPISFVGRFGATHPERTVYLAALAERYGKAFLCLTDYTNATAITKRSKIGFNHSLDDDLNFRVWEIMGAGTEVVTDEVTDIGKIRELTHRIHVYHDFPELVDIIDRIMVDDPSTTKNALDNQKWVKNRHCLVHRHLAILDMISSEVQHEF